MDCRQFEELYWLKAYGEVLPNGGESGYLEHLNFCLRCQALKTEFDSLRAVLTLRAPEAPKPEALIQARVLLNARLKAENRVTRTYHRSWWRETFSNRGAILYQPALALGLVVVGLLLGRFLYHPSVSTPTLLLPQTQQELASLQQRASAENILNESAAISDLRVKQMDAQNGLVQVSFKATKDYKLEGKPQDELIQELLTWAVKHEGNSGARLNSVEGLATASGISEQARQALAFALTNDKNDGVRLKALEALERAPHDYVTEQAILGALLHDPNPAVRIRAVDALLTDSTRDRSQSYLLGLAQADPNEYVRMRATQAIRQADFNYDVLDNRK